MSGTKVCPCVDCGVDVEVRLRTRLDRVRCEKDTAKFREVQKQQDRKRRVLNRTEYSHVCVRCSESFTSLKKVQQYCSKLCANRAINERNMSRHVDKPCVDCGLMLSVDPRVADYKVRCTPHRKAFLELMKDRRNLSKRNKKNVEAGAYPYEDWVVRGPTWSSGRATWGWRVTLLHKRSPNKKEMSYAEYLLSVKEGRKLDSAEEIVFIDGDIDNCSPTNLKLAQEQKEVA